MLHNLQFGRYQLGAVFLIHAFIGSKFCPSLIDNASHRVPSSNILNFTLVSVAHKNCPSARCAAAANYICNDADSIFSNKMLLWNRFCVSNAFHFGYGFNYLAEFWLNLGDVSNFLSIVVFSVSVFIFVTDIIGLCYHISKEGKNWN